MENYDSIFAPKEAAQNKTFSPVDKQAWAEKKQAERQQVYELIDETADGIAKDGDLFKTENCLRPPWMLWHGLTGTLSAMCC